MGSVEWKYGENQPGMILPLKTDGCSFGGKTDADLGFETAEKKKRVETPNLLCM